MKKIITYVANLANIYDMYLLNIIKLKNNAEFRIL